MGSHSTWLILQVSFRILSAMLGIVYGIVQNAWATIICLVYTFSKLLFVILVCIFESKPCTSLYTWVFVTGQVQCIWWSYFTSVRVHCISPGSMTSIWRSRIYFYFKNYNSLHSFDITIYKIYYLSVLLWVPTGLILWEHKVMVRNFVRLIYFNLLFCDVHYRLFRWDGMSVELPSWCSALVPVLLAVCLQRPQQSNLMRWDASRAALVVLSAGSILVGRLSSAKLEVFFP